VAAWRLAALTLLLIGSGLLLHRWGFDGSGALRRRPAGPVPTVMFTLSYALLTLSPVPKNALSASAGVLFGFATGVVVVWIGAMAGAVTAFGLARRLGRGTVIVGSVRLARLDELLQRRGLAGVLLVRLVPLVPFTAVNYASGFTALRVRDYTLGSAVGIVPGTAVFVSLGAFGTAPGMGSLTIMLASGLTLLVATSWAYRHRPGGRRSG
jgi:uncharacterized membrane protein YdjX (TVP38/TMEM64 family)